MARLELVEAEEGRAQKKTARTFWVPRDSVEKE
jgi:hypothetical protein